MAGHAAASRPLAVALLSGGLDSCVCLAEARRRHRVAVLHADYGQRTEARERRAFREIADHYRIPAEHRLLAEAPALGRIGGSSLTDPRLPVPQGLPEPGQVPPTYVPFRNAHLLAMGVSWAEVLGARAVYIGAVEEDGSGYPDCSERFLRRFAAAARAGTRPESRIAVRAPLLHLTKADIVRRGLEIGAPLHLTWSCYTGREVACGRCESCRLRLRGFAAAGAADPLPYAAGPPPAGRAKRPKS